MDINKKITEEFNLNSKHVDNIIALLDDGNTIPFIARYRKELTGHIDDQVLRQLADRLEYLRNLEKRKEEIEKAIDAQGKLTDEIKQALSSAVTLTEAEDIYRPFKQKKMTRATSAIEKGLQPLADILLKQDITQGSLEELASPYINEEKKVMDYKQALQGAEDIIAEIVSDNAELRKKLRRIFIKNGIISSKKSKKDDEGAFTYENYAQYEEPVSEIKGHRILALNRGEKEDYLKVKVSIDEELAVRVCEAYYVKDGSITTECVKRAVADSYDRLIEPSIEREIRAMLTENAQEQAIKMFEENLKPLLLQPTLKDKVVMGFDPGNRTGCKIAVVDETGKFLDKTVVYPTPPKNEIEKSKEVLKKLIKKDKVQVISIGNGTASKDSEMFVVDMLKEVNADGDNVTYAVVSEAGASVYSASKTGAEEFPELDVSERSAISIARRLQDPLAELIKIDPKSIGVGQYQHDMPPARLDSVLNGVLEDCVNSVGVDLNTASPQLLSFVSGLNKNIVKNIVTFREKNG
ncbi:MAG TPA: RNA-binding transcriptional accessory protein, partial [Clostridiales bacterium]|nr:RNA-binding transcriptional accessory protein [Clostridiales bacterium]